MSLELDSSMPPLVFNDPFVHVSQRTFLFPPVIVTLTNRRVYTILFFALPFGSFFFSCGSTYAAVRLWLEECC